MWSEMVCHFITGLIGKVSSAFCLFLLLSEQKDQNPFYLNKKMPGSPRESILACTSQLKISQRINIWGRAEGDGKLEVVYDVTQLMVTYCPSGWTVHAISNTD